MIEGYRSTREVAERLNVDEGLLHFMIKDARILRPQKLGGVLAWDKNNIAAAKRALQKIEGRKLR